MKKIGLIIGREWDWPAAFMTAVNEHHEHVQAELVKLGGTFMDTAVAYDLIIDRMSHEIPYYRTYLKYARAKGCYIVNNPFSWSADDKFYGTTLTNHLGLRSPKTVALPNKEIEQDTLPESFRNLSYPLDWQGIIDYVGLPAIFKDARSGGRRRVFRVHSVEELIQCYDGSGAQTMVLQELVESDQHVHCFVIGQKDMLLLQYLPVDGRYTPHILPTGTPHNQALLQAALSLTQAYQYDMNMVEFVIKDGEPFVINSTNPAPEISKTLMTPDQFNWLVEKSVEMALERLERPLPQQAIYPFNQTTP
ncbi:MAG: hypothetical protein H6662_10040 [Ardenticatenaceae bacterium]|nr:hypothetical protein [Anaerolineales bacterium]MCB8921915.1 hypothetical protein [Ardenticatenaceae bacterium]MCB8989490.1 hypothetical protein [Ardenticatenaceae bacterium]